MKNWIVIGLLVFGSGTLGSLANAEAAVSAPPKEIEKPSRYVNGTIKVNRSWLEKKADGSFEGKFDTVCKSTVKIPVYDQDTTHKNIDINDLKVFLCETETRTSKPVTLQVYGSLSLSRTTDFEGAGTHLERFFSGSYAPTKAPKPMTGSFALFSTKDLEIKSGTLLLPAPAPHYTDPNEAFDDTLYAIALSYEE